MANGRQTECDRCGFVWNDEPEHHYSFCPLQLLPPMDWAEQRARQAGA